MIWLQRNFLWGMSASHEPERDWLALKEGMPLGQCLGEMWARGHRQWNRLQVWISPTGERQVITWSEHGLEIRDPDLYHNSSYKTMGEQTYINSMWNGDRVIVRIKRDSGHKVLSTVPGIQSLPNNDNSRRCCQFYFIYLAIRFTSIGLHDILLIGRITYGTSQN